MEVDRESGRVRPLRFVAAVDSGQVVNPNGIANQIEGAILQSISWTLHEQVTFDRNRITSLNWASYPILRFSSVPDTVDVHIGTRPDSLSWVPEKPAKAPPLRHSRIQSRRDGIWC